jgi:hypothetical protein
MIAMVKKKFIGISAIVLVLSLYGVWHMNSRVYIDSRIGERFNDKKDQADVTEWVKEGGKVINHSGKYEGPIRFNSTVIQRKNSPAVQKSESLDLIKKAMVKVGRTVLQESDWSALNNFNPTSSMKYLETWAFDSRLFINTYSSEFVAPSGRKIILYPNIIDNDAHPELKRGDLRMIWECHQVYASCPDYVNNYNLDFLVSPDKY